MTAPRLSPAQRRVLQRMAEPDESACQWTGKDVIDAEWNFMDDDESRLDGVSPSDGEALLRLGLIETYGVNPRCTHYVITAAGRAALEAPG